MKRAVLAVILSALIFPGLGQVYKGEVRKGVFLILSASLLLAVLVLSFLIIYSFGYGDLLAQGGTAAEVNPEQLQDLLRQTIRHPWVSFIFGLFLATWVYGLVDAGRTVPPAR
ncbi:MAG: hypothetical protein ACUVRZ_00085 [Desulfobacca sp.]|uniref:hypothetical protein n=1 Tax=Desulfobacca sp. TaxID=2067990 RepID=UPI00404A5C76